MELKPYKLKSRKRIFTKQEANNIPFKTDELVHKTDIIIPLEYRIHEPHKCKIQDAVKYFVRYGVIDKPISVIAETNEQGFHNKYILVDEYSRYLALVEWCGLNYIPIKYINMDTYFKKYSNQ